MIAAADRKKMPVLPLCGERVLMGLESIGVARLSDVRGRDPRELMNEIKLAAGRRIWQAPMTVAALQNLVDESEREGSRPLARAT